jgi:hypothetical protein
VRFTGHDARFIDEIFPASSGTDFKGLLVVSAEEYICLEVLRMDIAEGVFC